MNEIDDTASAENALAMRPVSEMDLSRQIEADIRLAQLMAKARFMLPAHFHNQPAECLGVVRISRLWNMDPYMVAQKTSIINNRLMYEGQLINAAINNSRAMAERLRFTFDGEGESRTCTATGRIKGESEAREVTVGMPQQGQARNSPLWKGSQADKDQQLTYKAARVWARRHAPELTLGIYAPEDDWSDEEPEKVAQKDANQKAVQSRVSLLETAPAQEIDVTSEDFFVSKEPVPAGHVREEIQEGKTYPAGSIPREDMTIDVPEGNQQKPAETLDFTDPEPEKEINATGREISDNPEDRKNPSEDCKTCGGRQIVEDSEGKGPCPSCQKPKQGPQPEDVDDEFQF